MRLQSLPARIPGCSITAKRHASVQNDLQKTHAVQAVRRPVLGGSRFLTLFYLRYSLKATLRPAIAKRIRMAGRRTMRMKPTVATD